MSFTVNNAVKYIHEHYKYTFLSEICGAYYERNAVNMVNFSASDSLCLYLSL